MKEQNWTEQKVKRREKKGKKKLTECEEEEKTVQRCWLIEGTERSTCSQSERIRVEKKNRPSFRKHPLVNPVHRAHIHISSIHIQAPFYLWPFILRVHIDRAELSWMWTRVGASEHFISTLFCAFLARIGHKNLPIEVYRTKYAWLHSVSFRPSYSNASSRNLFSFYLSRSLGLCRAPILLLSICLSLLISIVVFFCVCCVLLLCLS